MDNPELTILTCLFSTHVKESDSNITDVEELLQEVESKVALIRKAHQEKRPFKVQYECVEMMAVVGKTYLNAN